jgi:hypothetical protein
MSLTFSTDLRSLHHGLVAAAKQYPWHASGDARIHHGANDRGNPNPETQWYPHVEECIRIVPQPNWILHLQIRIEANPAGRQRLIIFGRRVKSLSHATPNTQRATFNSDERESSNFYLSPRLDDKQAEALARLLGSRIFPRMVGKRILLGDGSPHALFRRYLSALISLEAVKNFEAATVVAPLLKSLDEPEAEFAPDDLAATTFIIEGQLSKVPQARRARCQRLLAEAQTYFRSCSPDGRLRCEVCQWASPLPTRREIVQIHHHRRQLSSYPRKGLCLTLQEALANLVPLCPNCHNIHESKPDGGRYDLVDLKSTIPSAGA